MTNLSPPMDDALIAARQEPGQRAGPSDEIAAPLALSGTELLELITDGIVSTNERGQITLFNKGAETLFGYQRAEVLGRSVEILLPERLGAFHRLSVSAFTTCGTGNRIMGDRREVIGRRKNGDEFPAEASLSRSDSGNGPVVVTVVIRDVSERKRAEEQRAILTQELAHRFKNMIAVVTSILSLTARNAPTKKALVTSLRGRLATLARTHELLLESEAKSTGLKTLIEGELAPYQIRGTCNVTLVGTACSVPGPQVFNVALAIHELATNAAKYGALSHPAGQVEISWTRDESRIELLWKETGGPPVTDQRASGFGTELMKRLLGPNIRFDFRPEGLQAHLSIPSDA